MKDQAEENVRVLLVDDDPDIRRDYARMLRSPGCVVDTAANGKEAIEHVRTTAYNAIVIDIIMPEIGGLQFLRAVREQDLDVPVVLMTGYPGLETAVEAIEYGAFRYLTKPVALETLTDVVRHATQIHRLAKLKREALESIGVEGKGLGDRAALEARFESALEKLWMAFQPIVRWSRKKVFGYEALVRSGEPLLPNPVDLLDAAERLGRIHDLGRTVRRLVASAAPEAPEEATLFVNIHGLELDDFELFSDSAPLSALAARVVLEITERSALDSMKGLGERIAKLRRLGFRISIDDFGVGYAGLASFTQIEPDIVKIDRALIQRIDESIQKQRVVRSIVHLCSGELRMKVIAEGVETAKERDILLLEGCDLLQGYLFARPAAGFPRPQW